MQEPRMARVRTGPPTPTPDLGIVAQRRDGTVQYIHFTKNYARFMAKGDTSPPSWRLSYTLTGAEYLIALKKTLRAETELKEQEDRRDLALDVGIVMLSFVCPGAAFLRLIEWTRLGLDVAVSIAERRLHHFAIQELATILLEKEIKHFIPVASPALMFTMEETANHFAGEGIKAGYAALKLEEERLSPTAMQIIALHRMRMLAEPAYRAQVIEAEKRRMAIFWAKRHVAAPDAVKVADLRDRLPR